MHLSSIWLSTLLGCGEDPVIAAAMEEAGSEAAQTPGGQQPGTPNEPAPGVPDEPPPGGGSGPGEIVPAGETVLVKGVITSEAQGAVVVDVFDGDHADGGASLVARKQLDGPGAYELKVPADSQVWISAYVDIDGDGKPNHEEPKGSAPNPVASGSGVEGLELTLE